MMLNSIDPATSSNPEVRYGWRLLSDICSEQCRPYNSLFFDKVDDGIEGLEDYYNIIHEPMWLIKIENKFLDNLYDSILEFVSDIRIMLLNCYHFNGRMSKAAKMASKLEMVFEQKLMLLPRDIREMCTMKMSLGDIQNADGTMVENGLLRRRSAMNLSGSGDLAGTPVMAYYAEHETQCTVEEEIRDFFSDTINKLKHATIRREERVILSKWEVWKQSHYTKLATDIFKYSAEWCGVLQFFHIIVPTLGISVEDKKCLNPLGLELGILLPQYSSLFGQIMYGILTSSSCKTVKKSTIVAYDVWEERLKTRVAYWYRQLNDRCRGNHSILCTVLGIDEDFFKAMGQLNPLTMRHFHELSVFQRVHICKALVDSTVYCQDSLARRLDAVHTNWPDCRPDVIGTRHNWVYYTIPVFTDGFDRWIYRERLQEEEAEAVEEEKPKRGRKGRPRKKPSCQKVENSVSEAEESNQSFDNGVNVESAQNSVKEEDDEDDDRILDAMYAPVITQPEMDAFELCVKTAEELAALRAEVSAELEEVNAKLDKIPKRKGRASNQRLLLEEEQFALQSFVDNLSLVASGWESPEQPDVGDIERCVRVKIGREVGLCPKPVEVKRQSRLILPPKQPMPLKRPLHRPEYDSRPLPKLVTAGRRPDMTASTSRAYNDEEPNAKRQRTQGVINSLSNHVRERTGLSSYQQLQDIRSSRPPADDSAAKPSSSCLSRLPLSGNGGLQLHRFHGLSNGSGDGPRRVYPAWTPPANGRDREEPIARPIVCFNAGNINPTNSISAGTLYRVGEYLFSSTAQPIIVDSGGARLLDVNTVPDEILQLAKKRIIQDKR